MKTSKEKLEELGYKESYIYPEGIEYIKSFQYDDWFYSLSVYFYQETKEFEIEFNKPLSLKEIHMLIDELDKLEVKENVI